MRRLLIMGVAILFVLALLSAKVLYTVRFTEAAVTTTFGQAGEHAQVYTAGLKLKWPYPIQSVTKYDTRTRFLEAVPATQQTADDRQIVVHAYCTWRVARPLEFFRRFSNVGPRSEDHYRRAEDLLRANLQSAIGQTSRYRLDELFTPEPGGSRLAELEDRILAAMKAGAAAGHDVSQYGIEILDVGIHQVELTEATSQAVFERMKEDRNLLARRIESEGQALAQAIRSRAESDAQRIEAFARAQAAEIHKLGDLEATQYVEQMAEYPELAVFLKNLELLREVVSKRLTLILSTDTPGLEPLSPHLFDNVEPGQVPGLGWVPRSWWTPIARVEPAEPAPASSAPAGGSP